MKYKNRQVKERQVQKKQISVVRKTIVHTAMFISLSIPALAFADGVLNWSSNRLFSPLQSLLAAELKGRITIYDGMDSAVVEKAMDEQFDRIENMMFIRTKHVLPSGEAHQDDDC